MFEPLKRGWAWKAPVLFLLAFPAAAIRPRSSLSHSVLIPSFPRPREARAQRVLPGSTAPVVGAGRAGPAITA